MFPPPILEFPDPPILPKGRSVQPEPVCPRSALQGVHGKSYVDDFSSL